MVIFFKIKKKSQFRAKCRIDECRVGQLFRKVFWGLKQPRTFSFDSLMDFFETLWVTFDPFRPLKVLKMDFYEEA